MNAERRRPPVANLQMGESLRLVVTLSPSVPQDKLREGSLIAREMLRFAQHDKLGKDFRHGVPALQNAYPE
jgi:hypothetical protein